MTLERALLSGAVHTYGAAAVLYLVYFAWQRTRVATAGALTLFLGFALHGAVIALRIQAQGFSAGAGVAEGLSALAWLLVGSYLVVDRRYQLPAVGAFVSPLVLAVLVPALLLPQRASPLPETLKVAALPIHVGIALLGIAAFAIATSVAVLYVLLEREMKFKRLGVFFARLPSLEKLDDVANRLVRFGFVALSVTIATGALFSKQVGGGYFHWDAKQTLSLVAWAVYAGVLNARLVAGWRGRRVALLTLVGFLVLVGSLVGTYAVPRAPWARASPHGPSSFGPGRAAGGGL